MIALRDYQERTVEQLRDRVRQNKRRVCVVMPTGAGKTRTLGDVVRRYVANGGKALWLAHRGELVDQAVGALSSVGVQCGAMSASASSAPQPYAPVQVATVQTLIARKLRPPAGLIVADEAHHFVAASFGALLRDYPEALVFGPTATPERTDGVGLGEMFQDIVLGVRVRELVEQGYLVSANVIRPERKLRATEIAKRPVDAYLEHARGRRAIVFSPTVAIAERHASEFQAAGLRAAVVTGETPWGERRERFDDLKHGRINALVNVYVATEGFDVPEIDCVILARGFGAAGIYIQCVGRALRPAAGKQDALILDLTGTSHVHGHPEDDRQYSLTGRGIRRDVDGETVQSYCRVCGCPIQSGEACPECGTAPKEIDQRVINAPLIRYAKKRAESVEERVKTLARWMEIGRSKGWKDSWALVKFKAVYGAWPPSTIQAAAKSLQTDEVAA